MGGHLKRLAAPRSWKIERKGHKWAVNTRPGPHPRDKSLPLLLIVRDLLKHANISREAKRIINEGHVLVDKRVRKDYKFPVGLMDIFEIPKTKERYRILYDSKGRIALKDIPKKDAESKLCKIVNKSLIKGGDIQINLHDGKNHLIKVKDARKPKEDKYNTKDTLVLDLKTNKISGHIKYKEGAHILVTGGSHIGTIAKVESIQVTKSPRPNVVTLITSDKEKFQTIENYVFVIGDKKPLISGVET